MCNKYLQVTFGSKYTVAALASEGCSSKPVVDISKNDINSVNGLPKYLNNACTIIWAMPKYLFMCCVT